MPQNTLKNAFQQKSPATCVPCIAVPCGWLLWHDNALLSVEASSMINTRRVCMGIIKTPSFLHSLFKFPVLSRWHKIKKHLEIILSVKMFSLARVSHTSLHTEWFQVLIYLHNYKQNITKVRLTYKQIASLHSTQGLVKISIVNSYIPAVSLCSWEAKMTWVDFSPIGKTKHKLI